MCWLNTLIFLALDAKRVEISIHVWQFMTREQPLRALSKLCQLLRNRNLFVLRRCSIKANTECSFQFPVVSINICSDGIVTKREIGSVWEGRSMNVLNIHWLHSMSSIVMKRKAIYFKLRTLSPWTKRTNVLVCVYFVFCAIDGNYQSKGKKERDQKIFQISLSIDWEFQFSWLDTRKERSERSFHMIGSDWMLSNEIWWDCWWLLVLTTSAFLSRLVKLCVRQMMWKSF